MIRMKRTLCRKYKQANNGIAESEKAFNRLDEAAPAHLKTEWSARERRAQSSRLNDPEAMDEYEINIKKAPSRKEIELRLLEVEQRPAMQRPLAGFDADDEPDDLNVDILDDLDDDPADFSKTSDTWTNSPELTVIPLASNLGVDRCRTLHAEGSDSAGAVRFVKDRANDTLHNLADSRCATRPSCSEQLSGRPSPKP
ncbi:hypothetical protein F4604DRAFT_1933227 [Suillus subluteus]|nr:hypothetical protein F4604DRAFT_1933227 [Suillus subluteus]